MQLRKEIVMKKNPIYDGMVAKLGHQPGDEKAAKTKMAAIAAHKNSLWAKGETKKASGRVPASKVPAGSKASGVKTMANGAKPNQTPKQKIKRGTK